MAETKPYEKGYNFNLFFIGKLNILNDGQKVKIVQIIPNNLQFMKFDIRSGFEALSMIIQLTNYYLVLEDRHFSQF